MKRPLIMAHFESTHVHQLALHDQDVRTCTAVPFNDESPRSRVACSLLPNGSYPDIRHPAGKLHTGAGGALPTGNNAGLFEGQEVKLGWVRGGKSAALERQASAVLLG